MKRPVRAYLGDGLYAEWNGFQIILKANDINMPSDTVYLEIGVMEKLKEFYEKVIEKDD